jgi:hypothetical protein
MEEKEEVLPTLATIFSGLGPLLQGLVFYFPLYSNKCGKAGGFITKDRELIKEKHGGVPPWLCARRQTRYIL